MKSRWLGAVLATALLALIVSNSSSAATEPSPAATKACTAISENSSDNAVAVCAQGYTDAGSGASLEASCALGVALVAASENERDCKFGFVFAGGPTSSAPTPTAKAVSECASITEGASDGSPAACEQGYEDALAGDTADVSCDHLGAGAITAIEYVTSCEDGWFVGKGAPGCIPGGNPEEGQPGSTIETDAEALKSCSAAS
jgi:hypothetical protein